MVVMHNQPEMLPGHLKPISLSNSFQFVQSSTMYVNINELIVMYCHCLFRFLFYMMVTMVSIYC